MRKNAPQHNIKDDQARTTQTCKECKDKPKIETLLLISSQETLTAVRQGSFMRSLLSVN